MTLVQPKQILKDADGNAYEILRYLGEGLTAEVYSASRGDERLALKILKPDLPADIVASFRDEASILRDLAHFERQEGDGLSLIPRVEGRAFEPQLPFKFLGLELVQGDPLSDLIERHGGMADADKEGSGERKALIIADQVLRVLDILHTYMRRSYTDFQLKNIWWQEDEQQVKVMDWNHVSLPVKEGERPSGVPHDLLRFGAYLYQVLTGKGVGEGSLADGRTEFLLSQRAGQYWQNISVGTRDIILKALHPNPDQRWQTAGDVRQAVQQQQERWQEPVGDISTGAVRAIRAVRRSEPQDALAHVQKAELYIDLYLRRGEDEELVERLRNELDELTSNVSANWGSGLQYYKAGIHSKSTPIWKAEAEALGRLGLWRWVMLSQLGEELPSDTFEAVAPDTEAALGFMEQNDWKTADEHLQKAQEHGANGDSFLVLINELQAHQTYRNAQIEAGVEKWTAAAAAYRKTIEHLSKIPSQYRALLRETYGWQALETKVHASVDKAADSNVNRDLVTHLQKEFKQSYDSGLELLSRTLKVEPDNTAVPSFVEDIVDTFSNKDAIGVLLTALLNGDMGTSEAPLRQLLREKQAKQAQMLLEEQVKQKQAAEEVQLADLRQTFATDFDQGLRKLSQTVNEEPDNSIWSVFVEKIIPSLSRKQVILLLSLVLGKIDFGSREADLYILLAEKQAEQKEAVEKEQLDKLKQIFAVNFDRGLLKLRKILEEEPDSPEIIQYVEKTAVTLPLNEAIPLLQTTVSLGNIGSRDVALHQMLAEKEETYEQERRASAQLAIQRQAQTAFENRDGIRLKELMEQLGNATPPAIVKQLQLDFDEAVKALSIYQVRKLANLLDLADEAGAERRSQQIENLPSQIDDKTHAWLNNLPVRVEGMLQVGEYEAARTEISKTKEFYANDSGVVTRADKLLPGVMAVEHINRYLDAADKQMRHRNGNFFEQARKSCIQADKELQSWNAQWIDRNPYQTRLIALQQQIDKEENFALKKELASTPLPDVLNHFSKAGLIGAKEGIEMEIKQLQRRNRQLFLGLFACVIAIIGMGVYTVEFGNGGSGEVAVANGGTLEATEIVAALGIATTPTVAIVPTETPLPPAVAPTDLPPTQIPLPTEEPTPTATPTATAVPPLEISMHTVSVDSESVFVPISDGDSFPYVPIMRLELPQNDKFIIAGEEEPLRFNHDGQDWDVNLLISGQTSEGVLVDEEFSIASRQVISPSGGLLPNEVDITWMVYTDTTVLPPLTIPGVYAISWQASVGEGASLNSESISISIVEHDKLNVVTGNRCRYFPEWVASENLMTLNVTTEAKVELLGFVSSPNNNATGFNLILVDEEILCWLPDHITIAADGNENQTLPSIPQKVLDFVKVSIAK